MKHLLTSLRAMGVMLLLVTALALPRARAGLAEALNPSLPWTTSTNLPWQEVFDITHDDTNAAQSAFLQPGQQSWVRTSVTGPGLIQFWWRVSSDLDAGFLRLKVGTNSLEISGEVDWDFVSFPIPPGSNQVEWIYDKHLDAFMDNDAGWLDDVVFVPGSTPPYILRSPESADLVAGLPLDLRAVVLGSEPLHYQWQRNGANLPGANGPAYTLASVLASQAGEYRLIATNAQGAATSAVAVVTVQIDTLAEALNSSGLVWETTPVAPWTAQTNQTHDGVSAAKSDDIFDNEYSAVTTRVSGPGVIGFWWKLSADDIDILSFSINGVEQNFIFGEVDWEKHTYAVPSGAVALEWTYYKYSPGLVGDDAGYLDQVTFAPLPRLAAPGWSNGVFAVSVPTQTGKNYALEYRDNLGGVNWTALPSVPGNGSVAILSDPSAPPARRFYRIKQF